MANLIDLKKAGPNGQRAARLDMSLSELTEIYESPVHPANTYLESSRQLRPGNGGPKWYGNLESTADATAIMRDGWKQGTEKLSSFKNAVASSALGTKSRRRVGRWADSGDSLSVDRALRGDWDSAWRTTRREWTPGATHVDLVVAWGGNCNMSAEQMFWNGAALCVAADILEDAGYTVRVRAVCSAAYYASDAVGVNVITVKEYADPLNIDGVASVFCHAGIFRTYGFGAILRMPFDVGGGLGSHLSLARFAESAPELSEDLTGPEVVMIDAIYNERAAVAAIRKVIARVEGGGEGEQP